MESRTFRPRFLEHRTQNRTFPECGSRRRTGPVLPKVASTCKMQTATLKRMHRRDPMLDRGERDLLRHRAGGELDEHVDGVEGILDVREDRDTEGVAAERRFPRSWPAPLRRARRSKG